MTTLSIPAPDSPTEDKVRFACQVIEQAVAEQLARVEAPPLMRTEAEKRHKAHWGAVQVSERATSLALQTIEDAQVLYARQQNLLLLMEWVRNGGNPEAPWPEIVRWKNAQNGETK